MVEITFTKTTGIASGIDLRWGAASLFDYAFPQTGQGKRLPLGKSKRMS